MLEEKDNIFVLTDEEGNELNFEHIDTFDLKDDTYVVMIPLDEALDENEEAEVVIFKLGEDEEGNEVLLTIEDEAEIEEVFQKLLRRAEEIEELEEKEEEE
jgi:uncharacterized protein YrzB (UPF0473 family)